MEVGTVPSWLALISSLLLILTTENVYGRTKCRGQWMSQVCRGGNGKRSDPKFSLLSILRPKPDLAREVVAYLQEENLPRGAQFESGLDSRVNQEEEEEERGARQFDEDGLSSERGEGEEEEEEEDEVKALRSVDVDTVRDLLTALTLQRALRQHQHDFRLNKRNRISRDRIL